MGNVRTYGHPRPGTPVRTNRRLRLLRIFLGWRGPPGFINSAHPPAGCAPWRPVTIARGVAVPGFTTEALRALRGTEGIGFPGRGQRGYGIGGSCDPARSGRSSARRDNRKRRRRSRIHHGGTESTEPHGGDQVRRLSGRSRSKHAFVGETPTLHIAAGVLPLLRLSRPADERRLRV